MRLTPILLALPLFALQAHAQAGPGGDAAPASAAAGPVIAAPVAASPAARDPAGPSQIASDAAQHRRLTWQQRFVQANVNHDGHLTQEEASGGYPTVARHFSEIDADKKGYVTLNDVDAWHRLQRAMRHPAQSHTDQPLRLRPTLQRGAAEPMGIKTSTDGKLLPTTSPAAASGAGQPGETPASGHGT